MFCHPYVYSHWIPHTCILFCFRFDWISCHFQFRPAYVFHIFLLCSMDSIISWIFCEYCSVLISYFILTALSVLTRFFFGFFFCASTNILCFIRLTIIGRNDVKETPQWETEKMKLRSELEYTEYFVILWNENLK